MGLVMVSGCAQVGSPDGGGRDETPPMVVLSDPPFGTTGFSGNSFSLGFDEFVQLKDARRQILVSPPLPDPPKVMLRGRRITVDLGVGLLPDRTYIVQFGDAVSDLRESNVAKGLQYVFSTGDVLDSGLVSGQVEDAWTGDPVSDLRVLLYRDSVSRFAIDADQPDSLRPFPDYVGIVNDSGLFDVAFLPLGSYGCVLLDDVNGNYQVDAGEALAWSNAPLNAAVDSADWMAMRSAKPFALDAPPPVPLTYSSGVRVDSTGYLRFAVVGLGPLKEGPDGLFEDELGLSVSGPSGPFEFGQEGDSLWIQLPTLGEADFPSPIVLVHPSGIDTLEWREVEAPSFPVEVGRAERTIAPSAFFSTRFAPLPTSLDSSLCGGVMFHEGDTLSISGSAFRLAGGQLQAGPFPPGAKLELELLPGALQGLGGVNEDTLMWQLNVRRPADYGTLRLVADSADLRRPESLWCLVDASGKPIRDRVLEEDGRFSGLLPGKYGVVEILDRDGNGRWTGNVPSLGRQPETVVRWATDVDVRAGWEVELQIDIHPRP